VPSVSEIRRALAAREPRVLPVVGRRHAAVAMVLRDGESGPEVLFIERASQEGDPWSGHMAFPGGKVDPGDAGGREAAERETREEVGLCLADSERLGRLDDKQGNPVTAPRLVISAYVYRVEAPGPLVPNHEVREAFWFPLPDLLDASRHVDYETPGELRFPGILVGEPGRHVVWGLTYSFLETFFSAIGRPLPYRWHGDLQRYARDIRQED
jgi:8-oxo-dGTP pyrophosphatase MutT (NUDIX family)